MSAISETIARTIAGPARLAARVGHRMLRHPLRLGRFHSRYCETSYGRMHYWDTDPEGGRPTAMLLHGLGANGLTMLGLASLLRKRRRVIVPDVFHFSVLSQPSEDRLDTYEHVTALGELVERLGVGPVDVAGHSVGGGAAIWFAVRFPEKTRSLAVFNPGGFSFDFERVHAKCRYYADGTFAERMYVEWLGNKPFFRAKPVHALFTAFLRHAIRHEGVLDYMETISSRDHVDGVIREITCPVLALWGDSDQLLSSQTMIHLVRELDAVEAYWVRGATHMLPIEAPYTVAERVLEFWDGDPEERSAIAALRARLMRGRTMERVVVTEVELQAAE